MLCQTESISWSLRAASTQPSAHITDFQSFFSSETKDDGVPWLVQPHALGQMDRAWGCGRSVQLVLDKQYYLCVNCDLQRTGQLWSR